MKRLILSLLLIVPAIFASAQRFAIVDENAILESMPDYVFAEKMIFETSQKYHAEFDKMTADIDKKYEDYQALNIQNSAPQAIRERRIQEIQNMQKQAQQFLATAQEEIVRLRSELVDPLKNKIHEAIRKIGVSKGYVFVFPSSQPLFVGIEVDDITELVRAEVETQA